MKCCQMKGKTNYCFYFYVFTMYIFSETVFFLFRISYIWYSALGFLITVIVGLIASFIFGKQDPKDLDWNLLSPPVRKLLLSFSDKNKQRLNIPLKLRPKNSQNVAFIGVLNMGLDINEENKAKEITKDFGMNKEKIRKISAPSSFVVTN
jgi:hypothetical protein